MFTWQLWVGMGIGALIGFVVGALALIFCMLSIREPRWRPK